MMSYHYNLIFWIPQALRILFETCPFPFGSDFVSSEKAKTTAKVASKAWERAFLGLRGQEGPGFCSGFGVKFASSIWGLGFRV